MGSRLALWIAIAGLGLLLSGCAPVQARQTASGPSAGPRVVKPQQRYSAEAGVALHRKANAASEIVGTLELHEGVLRYQRKAGFAYVTSQQSGLAGWVREKQLIQSLPEPAPDTPEPEPPDKSIFDPY